MTKLAAALVGIGTVGAAAIFFFVGWIFTGGEGGVKWELTGPLGALQ